VAVAVLLAAALSFEAEVRGTQRHGPLPPPRRLLLPLRVARRGLLLRPLDDSDDDTHS
jgi:hypothetical protein